MRTPAAVLAGGSVFFALVSGVLVFFPALVLLWWVCIRHDLSASLKPALTLTEGDLMQDQANTDLFPAVLRRAASLWWLTILPSALLSLVNGFCFWLVWGEMKEGSQHANLRLGWPKDLGC